MSDYSYTLFASQSTYLIYLFVPLFLNHFHYLALIAAVQFLNLLLTSVIAGVCFILSTFLTLPYKCEIYGMTCMAVSKTFDGFVFISSEGN